MSELICKDCDLERKMKKDGYIHITLSDGAKNQNGKWYASLEDNIYAIRGDSAGEAVENLLNRLKDKEIMKEIDKYWINKNK